MPPHRRSHSAWLFATAVVLITGVGCKKSPEASPSEITAEGKPRIVATTGMVADMVRAIVGDAAEVVAMMGPGVDPHLHQPTRSDVVALKEADVVVFNGLHLEGKLGEILQHRQSAHQITVAVADGLPEERLLDADAGLHDPHIWMDVSLWADAVEPLARELAAVLPEHAEAFAASAKAYRERLMQLDAWAAESLQTIPEPQRVMITAHDAFRYFGRRYQVEVHGVQGVSTTSEPAISDVNALVDLIVARDVKAVFFETSVSKRQVEAIVDGARARGTAVSSDHVLYSDSMGPAGSNADTYVGMIRQNVQTITEALGGTVASDPGQPSVVAP